MNKKGILIAIIGIDGGGKTTQASLLCKWLKQNGKTVYDVHNIPAYADWIFDTIAQRKGYQNTMELFSPTIVDFAVAIDKIRDFSVYTEKLSEQNSIIISQRYTYCKVASAMQNNVQHIELLNEIYNWAPKPDMTFYMDLPVEVGVQRVLDRGVDEENVNDLSEFKKYYESLPDFKDFIIIDANRSVEQVQKSLRTHVKAFLDSRQLSINEY
ncbi:MULTISPECIES: dTMP kinase [Cytobacillus]|uniref:Thymidylate kinase n=1 Tax=Cytobacillus oceanisediminis TaxID=665099 RepID=A0ABX3CJM5_9BACI|nr:MULTISPECIES: hypothetical protein [Cytobacillus]OHX40708.1 hypothetical protein BBV17_29085 [Cytobacillus oceanisediminis]